MKVRCIAVLAVLGLFTVIAGAQERARAAWSLAELEQAALENNAEIRLATRRVSLAEAGKLGAGVLDDPSFMYRGWGVPFESPGNLNRAQNMFMVGRTFPGPGKRGLRTDVARQDVEAARALLEATRREVISKVRLAFFQLLRSADELRLHHEQVLLAEQAMESARVKYTVGRVPQQEVLRAQIALTKLLDHRVMFETEADLARSALNTLIGRRPDEPLEISGKYSIPGHLPTFAELQELALQKRPELVAARSAARRDQLAIALARKAYTPDFTVAGGYMLMPSGTQDRHAYMAELSLNLPWLNRTKHDAEISQAVASEGIARAELDRVTAEVFQQIQDALVRARSALRLVELYRDTLRPQAEATFKAASAAYQTDRTDFLNLLDSQNLMLDVEYSHYRALTDLDQRLAELERAVGAPISRVPGTVAEVQQ